MSLDIGGAETHIVELASELCRRGHDVTVASNGGVYVERLISDGVKHEKIPLHSKNPLIVARAYVMLRSLIARQNFDIVHAHARIPAFICGRLARTLRFHFVTTCHGVYQVTPYWRLISDWGERSLAVSSDIKDYLIKNYGVCSDNITLTVNGINIDRFTRSPELRYEVEEELGLSHACKKRVVYVSRIDDESAYVGFQLVEAARKLYEALPDMEILIIGAGTAFSRLSEAAEAVNASLSTRFITLTGARTDIPRLLSACDAFIGVSRSALEAMAAGLPVILAGSRGYSQGYIGVFGEATLSVSLDTNFCCRGLPFGETAALGNDIVSLLSAGEAVRADMGEYNRALVRKYFPISRMADDAERVYTSLRPFARYNHGDVVISGYYGFGNTGDDSLLSVIIRRLRSIDPDMKITALSKSPKKTSKLYNVRAINRVNIISLSRELKNARLLLNGSGNLIQNGTSTRSLIYYTTVMRMAKERGCKIMMYASGIGPVVGDFAKKRAASAIFDSDMITLRESGSLDVIHELGNCGVPAAKPEKIAVTADPAYLIEPPAPEWTSYLLRREKLDSPFFLVALREWEDVADGYEENLIAAIKRIAEGLSSRPVFAVMQRDRDDGITERIAKACGGEILPSLTASELTAVAVHGEIVIGMRLHILIYAAVAGVPFVGLAYDMKIKAMTAEFSLGYLDVRELTCETLVKAAIDAAGNRTALSERIKSTAAEMKARALSDSDYVKKLM